MAGITAGIIAGAGALTSIVGGLFGAGAAKRAAQKAQKDKEAAIRQINLLESKRQTIINPYADVKDLSSMGKNAFANLGVATQAAEMQAEEADISLANTLDTIRSSGASAGGATALAQAALQSKKGVSASIEQQEATNEKMKAEGEQALNQFKITESQRMQQADVAGKTFVFNQTETRQNAEIDRVSGQATAAANREAQANSDRTGAITGMIGGIGSAVTGYMGASMAASNAKNP